HLIAIRNQTEATFDAQFRFRTETWTKAYAAGHDLRPATPGIRLEARAKVGSAHTHNRRGRLDPVSGPRSALRLDPGLDPPAFERDVDGLLVGAGISLQRLDARRRPRGQDQA